MSPLPADASTAHTGNLKALINAVRSWLEFIDVTDQPQVTMGKQTLLEEGFIMVQDPIASDPVNAAPSVANSLGSDGITAVNAAPDVSIIKAPPFIA